MATKRKVSNLSRILRDKDYRDDVPTLHNKSPSGDLKTPILSPVIPEKFHTNIIGLTTIEREEETEYIKNIVLEFVEGTSIQTNKYAIGDVVNLTDVNPSTTYIYSVHDIEPNTKYFVLFHGGSNPRPICFIDEDNKLLYKTQSTINTEYGIITTPPTATKIVVNNKIGTDYKLIQILKE